MSDLTGMHHLVRLILRRDRIRLPIWLVGITMVTAASANAVQNLYNTPEKIEGYARTNSDSAATLLMNGRPVALDTVGGITAFEVTTTAAVAVSLMVVFLVIRHTRAEEETGRAELLRATVTGRHAATGAAVLVAVVASLLVGLLDAAVLVGSGLETSGSVLHGAGLAGLGIAFTAVAAAAAQVTSAARGALGISGAVVAASFVIRGLGDVGDNWLRWLSPFGWAQGTLAFGDERWWPLLLVFGFGAAVLALTAYLTAHRDAGAGLLHPRPGRARAKASLGTSIGLAFRLQKGLIIGWAVGLFLAAVMFGSVGQQVVDMVKDNPELADAFAMGEGNVLDSFFAYSLSLLGVIATAYSVSSALRLRSEEEGGRAEALLATGLSRTRWVLGGLTVTLAATMLNLLLIGVGMGGTDALASGTWERFGSLVGGALALAPAVLAVTSAAVLLFGWLPRWTVLGWAVLGFAILQSYLGSLLKFPDAVSALSPFWHLPTIPTESFSVGAASGVAAVAVVLTVAGLVGVRRRNMT